MYIKHVQSKLQVVAFGFYLVMMKRFDCFSTLRESARILVFDFKCQNLIFESYQSLLQYSYGIDIFYTRNNARMGIERELIVYDIDGFETSCSTRLDANIIEANKRLFV